MPLLTPFSTRRTLTGPWRQTRRPGQSKSLEGATESGFADVVDGGIDGADRGGGVDGAGLDDAFDGASDDVSLDSTYEAAVEVGTDAMGTDGAADDGADAALIDVYDGGLVSVGLVALYPFDESSGATSADTSGNGHTASMNGAGFSPGLRGNAATMDGNSQYVSVPSGILAGLTSYSICAWSKFKSVRNLTRMFDFGTGTNSYLMFDPFNGAISRFSITLTGRPGEQVLDGPVATTGTWQHFAITRTGTTTTLYVDGANVARAPISLSPADLGVTTQNWLGRGRQNNNLYLDGQIDQFRIYSRGLSAAEVMLLVQLQE